MTKVSSKSAKTVPSLRCAAISVLAIDVDAIFSAEGDARNQLVLMMAIDIAVYHIFSIHNPQKMSQIRKDRYERAVEWLKQVAAFKITIDGAPKLPEEEQKQNSPWLMSSNPKRTNHL